ncbi:MAG: CRISPR-associated primase-polymerase type A1 [Proteobacteria bacterium]|nr:CRISPR-associated primase-polymerase type A1 [Pseudomonadota bacterium]
MGTQTIFWEKICNEETLYLAWQKVKANRGCPGIDRVSIHDFELNLDKNIKLLANLLRQGLYEPLPLLEREIVREDGKKRILKIPTVQDRILQEAFLLIVNSEFEKDFLNCSYGYRQGKSALMAVNKIESLIKEGFSWVVDADIKDFFDTVSKYIVIFLFSEKIKDSRIVNLVKKWICYNEPPSIGIPQGMVLSPLLANIYLHNFDIEIWKKSKGYVRYCDDFIIMCKSQQEAEELMKFSKSYLELELFLNINEEKTRICNIKDEFNFLGFHFTPEGKRPAKKSIDKLKAKIKAELSLIDKFKEQQLIDRLKTIIRGWQNYFGFSSLSEDDLLKEIDEKGEIFKDSIGINILKTALYLVKSDFNKAYEITTQSLDKELEDGEIISQRGLVYEILGFDQFAIDEYYQALKLDPTNPEILYHLGRKLTEQGKIERAIKLLQRAIQISSDRYEYYIALAEAYEKWGLYGSANKAIEHAKQIKPDFAINLKANTPPASTALSEMQPSEEDINLFIRLFSGREGVFAKQWINEYGQIGYSPIFKPLEQEDVKKHLDGRITLGSYLIRKDNTLKFAVIDFDISKKKLLHEKESFKDIDLFKLLLDDAKRILKFLRNLGLNSYLETSGWKGIHLWLFFESPIKADEVREFLKNLLRQTGVPPEGINREIFPSHSFTGANALGSLIKLPLGIHQLTGKRCLFLDEDGSPFENQIAFLWKIQLIKKDVFKKALSDLQRIVSPDLKQFDIEQLTEVKKILDGCKILRYLYIKAKEENDLTHFERLTILNTLGHVGDQGKKAIHHIISNCFNYRYEITEKWIGRLSKKPASCPKIRVWLSEITAKLDCHCEFKLDKDSYPSPVLHAGIKIKRKETTEISNFSIIDQSSPIFINENIDALIEEYLSLKKQKTELENKINLLEEKFNQIITTQKSNSIITKIGNLKKVHSEQKTKWVLEL